MTRQDREVRARLAAEAIDEPYMANLCRQHPELVETWWAIFVERGRDVIILSNDEVQGGDEEGEEEKEFDVDEWRRILPGDYDDDTVLDLCLAGGGLSRQDWLDLYHGKNGDDDE